jgi:hypothetical protein
MLRLGANWFGGAATLAAMGLMLGGCIGETEPTERDDSVSSEVKGGGKGKPGGGGTPTPTPSAVTCLSMHGRTVTAPWVSESVYMKAGERLTAKVSPARDGDMIDLTSSIGLNITFSDSPAITGLAFAPSMTGNYNLGWSVEAVEPRPTSLTWTFSCSPGG